MFVDTEDGLAFFLISFDKREKKTFALEDKRDEFSSTKKILFSHFQKSYVNREQRSSITKFDISIHNYKRERKEFFIHLICKTKGRLFMIGNYISRQSTTRMYKCTHICK